MKTEQALREQIENVEELHGVVKTMKSLAAVSIRQYQQAVDSLSEYNRTVELGFHALIRNGKIDIRRISTNEGHSKAVIVFGANQGMSGRFDQVIRDHFLKESRHGEKGSYQFITVLGERLRGLLESAGKQVNGMYSYPSTVEGITGTLNDIVILVRKWRWDAGISEVEVMHNVPASGSSFKPVTRILFPVSGEWLDALAKKSWQSGSLPLIQMDDEMVLAKLVREYIFVILYRSFAESLAAENASRLSAMQAAQNNIEDKLEELRRTYNQQRQSAITGELLDIISGFEALR